jgi:hypothetical protein
MAKPRPHVETPLTLSESALMTIVQNPNVQREFPDFKTFAKQAKDAGCATCGAGTKANQVMTRIRQHIMAMPQAGRDRIKELLNMPGRPWVFYDRTANGIEKVRL